MSEPDIWFELPPIIAVLVATQNALRAHYNSCGDDRLSSTLDDHLVGDIVEALAIEKFGLDLHDRNGEGVDGTAPNGRIVQVKATGTGRGPAFRHTKVDAEYLLFFEVDFERCCARVVFNGPVYPVRAMLIAPWVAASTVARLMPGCSMMTESVLSQQAPRTWRDEMVATRRLRNRQHYRHYQSQRQTVQCQTTRNSPTLQKARMLHHFRQCMGCPALPVATDTGQPSRCVRNCSTIDAKRVRSPSKPVSMRSVATTEPLLPYTTASKPP